MKTDKKTLELIQQVKQQKAEISKILKPSWITKCQFICPEYCVNFHAESRIDVYVNIVAFLLYKEHFYNVAVNNLGVKVSEFKWQDYTVAEWIEDIKMRIAKIQINAKQKKLESLEARLNSIISPELKAELELKNIEDELK